MKRKPIVLDKNTVVWIQVFTKHDDIDDVMYGVWDENNHAEIAKESAKEFIRQLKGEWTPRFLKELISACQAALITEYNKRVW